MCSWCVIKVATPTTERRGADAPRDRRLSFHKGYPLLQAPCIEGVGRFDFDIGFHAPATESNVQYSSAVENAAQATLRLGCLAERARLKPTLQLWQRSAVPWLADLGSIPGVAEQLPAA